MKTKSKASDRSPLKPFSALIFATATAVLITGGTKASPAGDDDRDHHDAETVGGISSIERAPSNVRKAFKALVHGAKVIEFERDVEDGQVIYEAVWEVEKVRHGAAVDKHGHLLELVKNVRNKALPEAVRNIIQTVIPEGAEIEYERKLIAVYAVEAEVGGRSIEFMIDGHGNIIAAKLEEEDDDEDEGDE